MLKESSSATFILETKILTKAQENRGLKNISSRRVSQPLSHQARGTFFLLCLILPWKRAEGGSTTLNTITESDEKTSFENKADVSSLSSLHSGHLPGSSRLVSGDPYFMMLPLTM